MYFNVPTLTEVFFGLVTAGAIYLLLVTFVWIFRKFKVPKVNNAPLIPGGIPFLGNAFDINRKSPHLTLSEWSRKYGDIYRIKLFGEEIVVLNSAKVVKECVFDKDNVTAGRPEIFRINYGFHNGKDVIFSTHSPKRTELKKLITKGLRSYGSKCDKIEAMVEKEVGLLSTEFSNHGCAEFDPSVHILTTVVNCITASLLGKRFARDDPQMGAYKIVTRLFSESCSPITGAELDMAPWLRFFGNTTFKKLVAARNALDTWVDKEIADAKMRFVVGQPQCIFDLFYQACIDSNLKKGEHHCCFYNSDLRNLFIDMLVSSTFTTSVAINCICLFMACFPAIQDEVRKQIHNTINMDCTPCYAKRKDTPLMEAVVYETLRYISHVPLSLPHFSMEDTTINDCHVPQNRKILLNLWNVHHDERVYSDPWSFKPNRFIDPDGHFVANDHPVLKNFLAFSGGRRACPGDTLSKERIFTIAAVILQKFHLQMSPETTADEKPWDPRNFEIGLILEPKPFKIKVVKYENVRN